LVDGGKAALESLYAASAEGRPFSIALLDMQMPDMDGAELGSIIKNDNRLLSNTHLVLLTSQGERGDARKFTEMGFAAYLSKPIDQSVLYNSLLQLSGIETDNKIPATTHAPHELTQFEGRVLVVEDNITNQIVAQEMLKKFGLKVDIAANGQEALDALNNLPYDLVLMDCQMPVMDGYEATSRIRKSDLIKDIVIVAMTANAMQGDREKCLAVGMNGFITKPVAPDKLREELEKWLPQKDSQEIKLESTQVKSDFVHKNNLAVEASINSQQATVFDYAIMSDRLGYDDALIHKVMVTFLDDMTKNIFLLKKAVNNEDLSTARIHSHGIKGAAASLGCMAFSDAAFKTELATKEKNMDTFPQILQELDYNFDLVKTEMEKIL
jgi:CheY-like chemotaxis protein/HPt (histidine-containing phosphotransfer) domain-containing protein